MHAIENTSLEAHVSICQERYQALERRFQGVDSKLDDLGQTLADVHDHVHALTQENHARWGAAHIAVIGVLTATIGFMASLLWG